MTHSVGAVCLGMLLFFTWLGFEVYERLNHKTTIRGRTFLIAFLVFTIVTVGYWTFISGHTNALIRIARSGFSGEVFGTPSPEAITQIPEVLPTMKEAIIQYRDSIPFMEQLFNQSGFFLFFMLAFIGSFLLVSKNTRNKYSFALVFSGLIILAINFSGVITRHGFLADRFNYFCQVLLAVPVGTIFFWLGNLFSRKFAVAGLTGIVAFVLSFLMIMSPQANMDNRIFSPNTTVRYAFKESEMQAINTVSNLYDGELGSDYYVRILRYLPDLSAKIKDISKQIYSQDFSSCQNTLILIRDEILNHPFKAASSGIYRLKYSPEQALIKEQFSKIYECGSISGFIK
jgi:hypothetical protein